MKFDKNLIGKRVNLVLKNPLMYGFQIDTSDLLVSHFTSEYDDEAGKNFEFHVSGHSELFVVYEDEVKSLTEIKK